MKELVNNIASLLNTISPIVSNFEQEVLVMESNFGQIMNNVSTTSLPTMDSKPVANYKGYSIYIKEDSSGLLPQSRGVAKDVNGQINFQQFRIIYKMNVNFKINNVQI